MAHVDGGQRTRLCSHLSPFCLTCVLGFLGLNSGPWTCIVTTFTCLNISPNPTLFLSIKFLLKCCLTFIRKYLIIMHNEKVHVIEKRTVLKFRCWEKTFTASWFWQGTPISVCKHTLYRVQKQASCSWSLYFFFLSFLFLSFFLPYSVLLSGWWQKYRMTMVAFFPFIFQKVIWVALVLDLFWMFWTLTENYLLLDYILLGYIACQSYHIDWIYLGCLHSLDLLLQGVCI